MNEGATKPAMEMHPAGAGETTRIAAGPSRFCPRCHSTRVHRSHRRMALDYVLYALGADIRRCRDCRHRHASFVSFAVPLADPKDTARRWTTILIMASGFLMCLVFIWWMIRRFTEMSG